MTGDNNFSTNRLGKYEGEGNSENIHQVEAKIRGARVQREHPVFSPPRDVYCFKFLANPRNCARKPCKFQAQFRGLTKNLK